MASNRALLLDFDLGETAERHGARNSANEIASWAADIDKRNQFPALPSSCSAAPAMSTTTQPNRRLRAAKLHKISEIRRMLIDRELFEQTA